VPVCEALTARAPSEIEVAALHAVVGLQFLTVTTRPGPLRAAVGAEPMWSYAFGARIAIAYTSSR
jgi:hypothetical protein